MSSSQELGGSRSITRVPIIVMLGLTVLVVVVGGLRFARMDVAGTSFFATDRYYTFQAPGEDRIENLNIDLAQYLSMVEKGRGDAGAFEHFTPYPEFASNPDAVSGPVAPFIHRPAIPYLASLLPFGVVASLALVNLVLVVAGLWFLVDALAVGGRSPTAQIIGGLLYAVALPVLVFASSLYIDGGTMAVFVIGYWLIVRRYWVAFALFLPISFLFKEAILMIAPVAAVAWWQAGRSLRDRRFLIGGGLSIVAWVAVMQIVRVSASEPVLSYTLMPKWSYLGGNIVNVESMVFVALGLAPVMVLALAETWHLYRRHHWRGMLERAGVDVTGLGVVVAVNAYSVVATDLTLRTFWLVFPFAISLTARCIDRRFIVDGHLVLRPPRPSAGRPGPDDRAGSTPAGR